MEHAIRWTDGTITYEADNGEIITVSYDKENN